MLGLTDRLAENGVERKDHLVALAALPDSYRDKFLRRDLQLNAFEATVLCAGLEKAYSAE